MCQSEKEKLCRLLEEFQINKGIETNKHIELLRDIEKCPQNEVLTALNLFLEKEINPGVLLYLIKSIGKFNDKSSVGVLTELLIWKDKFKNISNNSEDYLKVRCMAATILGNIKDNNSVISLLYILNSKDENYKLRLSCAEALGKIGNKYAVAPLIEVVSDEAEKSIYVRESAAKALGLLGDIRAIDPLISILETKKGLIDKFTFLKERVIESLGRIGLKDNRTIKVLKIALSDESSYIRLGAVEALSELDDPEILPLLEKMTADEEEDVARAAINALYNIKGVEYIKKLLQNDNLAGWCKDEIECILNELEADGEEIE